MKTKWWRYILAIVTFLIADTVIPVLFGLVWSITSLFSPEYYRSSPSWTLLVSTILGTYAAIALADYIVQHSPKFIIIMCTVVAVVSIAVGVWNYALGNAQLINMISMLVHGIVAIGYAIWRATTISSNEGNHHSEPIP